MIFDSLSLKARLYRLHGSLYWFSIENGRTIKLPVKGLKPELMRYISDDVFGQMILYPRMQKEKYSEIYAWLSSRFISKLNQSNICIIIGYSFRDEEIVDNILQALKTNNRLWVIIVSPRASEHKQTHFKIKEDLSSRILNINMGIAEALEAGKLYSYIEKVKKCMKIEEELWVKQHHIKDLYIDWYELIKIYEHLGLNERIDLVCKNLKSMYGFTDERLQELLSASKAHVKHHWPIDL